MWLFLLKYHCHYTKCMYYECVFYIWSIYLVVLFSHSNLMIFSFRKDQRRDAQTTETYHVLLFVRYVLMVMWQSLFVLQLYVILLEYNPYNGNCHWLKICYYLYEYIEISKHTTCISVSLFRTGLRVILYRYSNKFLSFMKE